MWKSKKEGGLVSILLPLDLFLGAGAELEGETRLYPQIILDAGSIWLQCPSSEHASQEPSHLPLHSRYMPLPRPLQAPNRSNTPLPLPIPPNKRSIENQRPSPDTSLPHKTSAGVPLSARAFRRPGAPN